MSRTRGGIPSAYVAAAVRAEQHRRGITSAALIAALDTNRSVFYARLRGQGWALDDVHDYARALGMTWTELLELAALEQRIIERPATVPAQVGALP